MEMGFVRSLLPFSRGRGCVWDLRGHSLPLNKRLWAFVLVAKKNTRHSFIKTSFFRNITTPGPKNFYVNPRIFHLFYVPVFSNGGGFLFQCLVKDRPQLFPGSSLGPESVGSQGDWLRCLVLLDPWDFSDHFHVLLGRDPL